MPKLSVFHCYQEKLSKSVREKAEKESTVFNVIDETLTESINRVNFVPNFLKTGNSCASIIYVLVNGNPS